MMLAPKTLRQLAAYSVSLPTFAATPKLANETVYMPSRIAALVLGRGDGSVGRMGELVTDAAAPAPHRGDDR
jgi:hypothetical protein